MSSSIISLFNTYRSIALVALLVAIFGFVLWTSTTTSQPVLLSDSDYSSISQQIASGDTASAIQLLDSSIADTPSATFQKKYWKENAILVANKKSLVDIANIERDLVASPDAEIYNKITIKKQSISKKIVNSAIANTTSLSLASDALAINTNNEKQIELAQSLVASYPNDPNILIQLALAYESAGQTTSAKNTYKQVLIISPNSAVAKKKLVTLK